MKFFVILTGILLFILFELPFINILERNNKSEKNSSNQHFSLKDTCIIEGLVFKMIDYKSSKKLNAYIKNGQIYVVNQGLQYAKYRIIYYVFSSVDDEQMPPVRHFNQRLSPPILNILKNAKPGNQYIFEEIVVIDPSNKELNNAVQPILIERIKN